MRTTEQVLDILKNGVLMSSQSVVNGVVQLIIYKEGINKKLDIMRIHKDRITDLDYHVLVFDDAYQSGDVPILEQCMFDCIGQTDALKKMKILKDRFLGASPYTVQMSNEITRQIANGIMDEIVCPACLTQVSYCTNCGLKISMLNTKVPTDGNRTDEDLEEDIEK